MTGSDRLDVPRLLATIRARRWLIVAMVVVAGVLALLGSLAQSSRYEASADLLFGRTTNSDAVVADEATDSTTAPDRQAANNLALASLDSVAARVKQRIGGSATVDELRHAVTIKAQGSSDVVTVTAEWSSAEQAAAIANAFAGEIVAQRRESARADIQQAIDALEPTVPQDPKTAGERLRATSLQEKVSDLEYLKARADGNVHFVERATAPDHRSTPTPVRNALVAGFLAVVLGLLLIVLLTHFDDRIRDEDELAELMETSILTRVPKVDRMPDADRAFRESFEFLRLNLQLMRREGESLVVAVTSPGPSQGTTTVVSRLARALTLSGDEVATVDPHAELIVRARLRQRFEELAAEADWVLVDTVPVSTVADATAVAAAADRVILVVDLERARRRDLEDAKRQLANARAELLGMVLNRAPVDFAAYPRAAEAQRGPGALTPQVPATKMAR